jgi:hypothetical protein
MRKALPEWVNELRNQYVERARRLADVMHLSIQGICMIRGQPHAVKTIAMIHETLEEGRTQQPDYAEQHKERLERS